MYLIGVGLIWGPTVACFAIGTAIVGFLLLESVNYIEHYGLVRKQLASGRYEPVTPRHSWNSNHELGRIFLYELTRHSDHHYKATRKYQVLRHMDESPQLPLGYPTSILMALVPPLWFKKMNPIVKAVGE
jgi:alkane 1-monooxygenase